MKEIDFRIYDMSFIEEEAAEKQQFYWVGFYYFMAREALETYGFKGEQALRKSIRGYGRERGQRMRRIADSKGLPANLVTLFDYYDLMSDPRFVHPTEGLVMTPEVKKSITGRCPDAEMWSRLPDGLKIGSIYCEEVHHQIYQGFDPAIQVNLCDTLTNGGSCCRFHLYCRKANQQEYPLPAYEPQSWDDFENNMTASIYSIFCIMYFTMCRILKDELGESAVREALEQFCFYRGLRMRKLHERKKIPVSIKSFLQEGDMFLDPRLACRITENEDGSCTVSAKRDIMAEISRTYDGDDLKKLYDEVSCKWLLKGYDDRFACEFLETSKETPIHIRFIGA